MGFRDLIKRPLYQASLQRPWSGKATAEIVRVTPKGGDLAVLDVNIYTGDESPWQGPRPYSFRTILPKGVQPRVGQVVLVGEGGGGTGNNSPPPVFWDEPAQTQRQETATPPRAVGTARVTAAVTDPPPRPS